MSIGLVFLEANACGTCCSRGENWGVMDAVEEGVSGFTVRPEDWRVAAYFLLGITINTCRH